MENRNRYRITC